MTFKPIIIYINYLTISGFLGDNCSEKQNELAILGDHQVSYAAPALRLPRSIIYSKIHCIGKCPFMVFSNVFCVSEDVNSSVVDHGARGHFWKMSVDEKHQFNKMCWFWRMEEANSMEWLPILSSVRT